jgi:formate hydrogenlyase transcriptional activator
MIHRKYHDPPTKRLTYLAAYQSTKFVAWGLTARGIMMTHPPTQLTVSGRNMELLYQEIEKRKTQQSRIFAFSNAIASERDRIVLAQVLKVQLKELFEINEYAIFGVNTEKSTYAPLLYDIDASAVKPVDVHELFQNEIPVNNVISTMLLKECPVFLSLQDWEQLTGPLCYKNRAAGKYSSKLLGVPIRMGQENIAVMIFSHENYDKMRKELSLFKSILSQIAIVVCNVIAHLKIGDQLIEISRYRKALADKQIQEKEEIEAMRTNGEMIGECPAMQQIFGLIRQVAPTDSTVLILGKTGTGKELVAKAIHNDSSRKDKPLIKLNCAALPAHLIESELFGHERGSFTGATERRLGKFELANGGTLFLDEIGEMPPELQVKLLRALQEREIERIGGKGPITVDIRIIAATNLDLEKEMAAGRFRSDLYYRLNIFPIVLPELKDRKEDIPELASHFVNRLAKKTGRKIKGIGDDALQDLLSYDWPGNIRELEHVLERSIILTAGDMLTNVQLPEQKPLHPVNPKKKEFAIKKMEENEKEYILNMIQHCKGKICGNQGAAELMGIPSSTLFSKMKKLGIKRGF